MSNKEKLFNLYNRTYHNCLYYKERNMEKELLNEIGVLRGIGYCLDAITGDKKFTIIDFTMFREMIEEQNRIRNAE